MSRQRIVAWCWLAIVGAGAIGVCVFLREVRAMLLTVALVASVYATGLAIDEVTR